MREITSILKDIFGDSSESDTENESNSNQRPPSGSNDDDDPFQSTFRRTLTWDPVTDINGLWICRDFLSPEQQSFLLLAIQNEGWFNEASHNQAMRFGDLPTWATELSDSISEAVHFSEHGPDSLECTTSVDNEDACNIFPPNLMWREPLFDQLIVNVYQPGDKCTC
ncbi:uncharacterized protein LOC124923821 isoform X2 [Impatiens glandulifera]|uniref:uncharacterized protein LOC124923821 isoform X2 n=1 Tax=Impatiens glandulifera TaxID=253017 RepID=UPI001FB186CB|nr:uncharacterized protein LOC124923821 isoform X2 [Impatiens glandulifera]